MEWMSKKQREDFDTVCLLIDGINSPKEFYRVMGIINSKYDVDVVNCARELKKCYSSSQYI